jgi:hypothetical protein
MKIHPFINYRLGAFGFAASSRFYKDSERQESGDRTLVFEIKKFVLRDHHRIFLPSAATQ